MMKNLIKLMPAMALAMFVNQTQAQWTTTGTVVAPTTLTNNVSIGTTTNGANLYVEKSNAVTMGIKSTTAGATMFMDKGVSTANAAFAYRNLGVTIWNSGMLGSNNFAIRNVALNSTPILVNQISDNVSLCSTGGKVGVGTATPSYKFEVAAAEYNPVLFRNTGTGTDKTCLMGIRNGNTSTVQWFQGVGGKSNAWGLQNGQYYIEHYNTTSAPKMVIDTSGNVGIGTLAPAFKLHVTGNALFTGNLSSFADFYNSGNLVTNGFAQVNSGILHLATKTLADDGSFGLTFNADPLPITDNFFYCGDAAHRWVAVYAVNGTIQTSDARMKKDIKDLSYGLNEIMKLQPISYKWKDEKLGDDNNLGFIAQDLQKVVKEVVVDHTTRFNPETNKMETTKNDVLGVKYSELIPVLVKAIQEQQEQITTLKNENASMQDCLNSVCNNATESKTKNVNTETSNALFQNQPNPFNQTTVIRFALTVDSKSANIVIRNLNGEQIKAIALNQTGKGQVTINANELAQGTYTYTLIVNGESVDTKLMVVTK